MQYATTLRKVNEIKIYKNCINKAIKLPTGWDKEFRDVQFRCSGSTADRRGYKQITDLNIPAQDLLDDMNIITSAINTILQRIQLRVGKHINYICNRRHHRAVSTSEAYLVHPGFNFRSRDRMS